MCFHDSGSIPGTIHCRLDANVSFLCGLFINMRDSFVCFNGSFSHKVTMLPTNGDPCINLAIGVEIECCSHRSSVESSMYSVPKNLTSGTFSITFDPSFECDDDYYNTEFILHEKSLIHYPPITNEYSIAMFWADWEKLRNHFSTKREDVGSTGTHLHVTMTKGLHGSPESFNNVTTTSHPFFIHAFLTYWINVARSSMFDIEFPVRDTKFTKLIDTPFSEIPRQHHAEISHSPTLITSKFNSLSNKTRPIHFEFRFLPSILEIKTFDNFDIFVENLYFALSWVITHENEYCNHYEIVNLKGFGIQPAACSLISQKIKQNSNIKRVILSENPIYDEGAQILLSGLRDHRRELILEMKSCGISHLSNDNTFLKLDTDAVAPPMPPLRIEELSVDNDFDFDAEEPNLLRPEDFNISTLQAYESLDLD